LRVTLLHVYRIVFNVSSERARSCVNEYITHIKKNNCVYFFTYVRTRTKKEGNRYDSRREIIFFADILFATKKLFGQKKIFSR